MTGEALKAHVDAALAEKKIEATLDYFRKGLTIRVLAKVNGLTHLKSKIGSVAIKIHNEVTSGDITSLVEAKVDEKALLVVALKGALTPDSVTANAKITALTTTLAGDIMLTKKGGYSAIVNLELPKRIVGVEAKFAGTAAQGLASLLINTNKKVEDNIFEYGLKWSTAAPKDRQQFSGELTIKSPVHLFPLPIKMTALFSRDIQGTYMTDLVIDYGFKFEFKGIHKCMPIGIETNVAISTPIEGYEKMTGELIATLAQKTLNFKLAAIHNKKAIEVALTGKAAETHQELDFTFKTPFTGMEMITASIKNKIADLNVDASAELKWGLNKKVAIVFANKANTMKDIKGKLTVVTPIETFETTTLEYGFTTKADARNLLVKFTCARNQVTELTAVLTTKPDMKVGFIFESVLKVPTIEDLKFNIDLSYKPMKLIDMQMTAMFGGKAIALIGKASKSDTKIDASLLVKTPKTPEGISAVFTFVDPNKGKNLDASVTLTLGPKRVIKFTTYVKKENWNHAEGKMELTSFFADKVAADFGWQVSEGEGIVKTNLALEYMPGKKITFDLDFMRRKTDLTFNVKMTTPLDPLHLIKYSIKSTGGLDNLKTHVEGQFNKMIVATDIAAKILSWKDFEMTLTTTAPIRNFEKTSIMISFKDTATLAAKATLLLKGQTWGLEIVSSKLNLNNMESSVTINTPLKNWEKTALVFTHKATSPTEWLTKTSLLLNGKTWAVEGKTHFAGLKDMSFDIIIATPLKNIEKITLKLSHKGGLENMVSKVTFIAPTIKDQPLEIEIAARFAKLADMQAKITLKGIPIEGAVPVVILVSNHGENLKPLLTIFSVTIGPKAYSLTSTLNFEAITSMDGSLVATTPIAKYERVGLTWSNKMANGKKDAKLVVEFQTEQRITLEGHILKKDATIETHLTLTTPFAAFDKATFDLVLIGVPNNFKVTTRIALPKLRTTEVHFTHMLDLSKGIVHKTSMRIDCIFFSTTSFETTLELKAAALKFDAKFGYGLRKGEYSLTAKLTETEGMKFELGTTLKTDWTHAKSLAFTLMLAKAPKHVLIATTLKWNEVELLSLNIKHIPLATGGQCTLTLKQKLVTKIAETLTTTVHVEATLSKSMIKITTLANNAPLTLIEFMHTYETSKVTAKLILGFKTMKAETNILISKPTKTLLIQIVALKDEKKILDFITAYELTAEKIHALKIKAVYEGKTLVDILLKFKPEMKDVMVTVEESGRKLLGVRGNLDPNMRTAAVSVEANGHNLLGLKGNIVGHKLEAHIILHDAPFIDLVTEFHQTPLTLIADLKYKGETLFVTKNVFELKQNSLEIHVNWNKAPLIDLKTEFRAEPYTLAIELKYLGKAILTTRNILDLKAKTISALLNIDPLLEMIIAKPTSWILSMDGSMVKRRDLTVFALDIKKADKLVHIELTTKTAGKLSWNKLAVVADLKLTTKNIGKGFELSVVTDVKRSSGYLKSAIVIAINKVEYFKHMIEAKDASKIEFTTEIFVLPLSINTAVSGELAVDKMTSFKLAIIGDKGKEKDTTIVFSGLVTPILNMRNFVLDFKTILPTRTMVLKIKNVLANKNLEHLVSFSWEAGKSTGYSFTLADRSKRGATIYNIDGEFTHPIRTVKYTAKAEISPRKYLFALDVLPDATLPERKTFVKIDIANESNGEMINLKTEATFGHPSLETPLALGITLTLNRGKILMATSMTLDYSKIERKRISSSFRIVKEPLAYKLVAEVKQPANFVDVRINADIKKRADNMIEQTTSVSYLTSKRETKTVTFNILANLLDKKIEVRLTAPGADKKVTLSLLDKRTAEGRHVRLFLTHEDMVAKIATPILDVEMDEPSHALRIELANLFKVDAGIHNKYMVRLSIIAKGKKTLLLKTNFKDATHMLINTRLEWDPVLIETIKTEVPPLVAKATAYMAATWEPIVKVVLEDIQTKINALKTVGWKDLKPLFEAWKKFVRALDKDMTTAIKGLKQMWRQNEFYLKDAGEVLMKSWEKFMITYKHYEVEFWNQYKHFMAHMETNHKELMAKLRSLEAEVKAHIEWLATEFAKLRVKIETTFKEIRPRVEAAVRKNIEMAHKKMEAFVKEYEPKVKAMVAQTMKTIGTIRDTVAPIIVRVQKQIDAWMAAMKTAFEPLRVKLVALWAEFVVKMEAIKKSGVANALVELQKEFEVKYATTSAAVVAWLREMHAKLEAVVEEYKSIPQVVELKKSVDVFCEKLVWAWKYLNIEGEVKKMVAEIKMRHDRFWRIIKDNKSAVLVWDTKAGILDFDVEIPIALKELARLPKIDDLLSRLDTIRKELIANAPKIGWTPMDYYYYWKPRTTSLPPFTAHGIVAGNQHYFTFDGSYMEFAGDCSYVLARDFAKGKFTVIANYRRTRAGPKRQSITVMAGPNTVEVFNTFKTVVDRDIVELPLQLEGATIKRAGADQVTIESNKGMTVSCHMKTEICTVAISGWYFGKTGGLLGTYDYEPITDMTNPMGKRLEDVERFANTWEVAKTCSDKHNYAKAFHKVANIKTTPSYRVCADLFLEDSSALRPALRVIDATPFMNMCLNDVFEWQNHPQAEMMMRKKACTAVAAYMAEAKIRGIPLKAPVDCMSCMSVEGHEMPVGVTEKVTRPIEGVDTVVVVEENSCNRNKRKDLLGLISTLQKAYKKEGLKDNLFGLAAFGGPGVHKLPHFHTIEGELMNTDRKFVRGVRGLEFAEETPRNFVEGAIAFAAKNYPWRAGYRRNIIVVSCSQCMDTKPANIDLGAVMTETKVTVHMLRDIELAFRGGKRAAHVLGFDKTGVFTTKATSATTLQGDAALLAQLAVPKEHCLPALMDMDGTFFTINSWTAGRVREQKKLVEVVSRRVAVASKPDTCQICECKILCPYTMRAQNVCKPCRK